MERVQNLRAEAFEVCDVARDDDEAVNQRGKLSLREGGRGVIHEFLGFYSELC
jgi:hypothetical protein